MSAIFTAILLLATTGSEGAGTTAAVPSVPVPQSASATANNEPVFAPRKSSEMRKSVSDALRAAANAKDRATRDLAIRKLILILLELEQDHNLMHDERVELHTQVRSRLISLQETLQAEVKRDQQASAHQAKPANPAAAPHDAAAGQIVLAATAASNAATDQQARENLQVLAQIVGGVAGVNVQQGAIPGGFARGGVVGVQPVAGGAGGGGVIGGGIAGGNGQQADYGPDLVALIQTVVAPRTWDINGGPGSIVYYRNLQALVVRAPSEVHEQLGDILGQLRK